MAIFATYTSAAEFIKRDVCVYGASPAAMTAALQVRAQGRSVALLVPGQHVGGMLVEGLGSQDVNKNGTNNVLVISGFAREFYQRVGAKYGKPVQYTFEPHVAVEVIEAWLAEAGVEVFRDNRLVERFDAVLKDGSKIVELEMENGNRFRADMFIDGTIEGDLMKWAGVSYTVGRESNATYGETLNGVRGTSSYRQFEVNVDPYVVPGDPSSGLIATIQDDALGTPGEADDGVMGFCFRQTLTKISGNRIPFTQPADYDPANYEIYRRYFAAGGSLYRPSANLPNGKTDLGSWHDLSGNLYGYSKGWPDGTYAEREAIYTYHRNFIQGLYWFLANDPAVPAAVRDNWSLWGLAADEFLDNGGWPRSLYIRAGRRMISDLVLTEAHTKGQSVAADSIGVAWWPPDMHHARRIVRNGFAYNEGFVFANDYVPFPISYRAIVPKSEECTNLLVPAALSSSYVAYGSVRLEWTQMICGQSAGAAAAEALRAGSTVQEVDYASLRVALLASGLVLEVPSADTQEGSLIIDNSDPTQFSSTGAWVPSTTVSGFIGTNYLHDGNTNKGSLSATFTPILSTAGSYQVYGRWSADDKRDTNVPVRIVHAQGQSDFTVNQQQNGNQWNLLGTFDFAAGDSGSVTYRNEGTTGYVIVDAILLVPADGPPNIVSVTPTQSQTGEGHPTGATFSIVREGDLSSALDVTYEIGGTAINGVDYALAAGTVHFAAGQAVAGVDILAAADEIVEGAESVMLTLQADEGYSLGDARIASVIILDRPDQDWQFTHFTAEERLEGVVNAPGADPDKDGRNNLIERFSGTNPRFAESEKIHYSSTAHASNGDTILSYYYLKGAHTGDLTASIEATDDLLGPWTYPVSESVPVGWDARTGNMWMRCTAAFPEIGFVRLRLLSVP
ncbi:MAG: FAD-dependent oxidoreductase [Kiritimatiellia bacterium]